MSIISPNLASTSSAPATHSSIGAFDQRSLPCSYSSAYRARSASENSRPGNSPMAAIGWGMCGGRTNAGAASSGTLSSMEDVRDREPRRTQGRFGRSRGRLDCWTLTRSSSLPGEAGLPRFVEFTKRVSKSVLAPIGCALMPLGSLPWSFRFTGPNRSTSVSVCSEK